MFQVLMVLVSFLGWYLLLFYAFSGKRTALYPAVITSAITVAGFVAGLAGCMQGVFSFIYYSGFLLVPFCLLHFARQQNQLLRPIIKDFIPFAVFSIGAVWLYTALDGYFLYNFDDFSHWGRIARIISSYMRFPIESDLLTHASYVPGSALFIGYMSNILGSSDAIWLFAQGLMLLSFWITLLSASKNVWIQMILSLLIIPFMSYNTPLRALFVDNLLAAAAFAGIVACMENRKKPGLFALSLILCSICLIKTSGMLFVVLIILYTVYFHFKDKRALTPDLLLLILPIILYVIWNKYIDLHFTEGLKHRLSLDNYQGILEGKTSEDIITIFEIILPIMGNPLRNHALFLIPGYLVLLLIYKQQGVLQSKKNMVVFSLLAFLIYEIGILLMYVFSMPMTEIIAQNGQDYDRYNGTITATLLAFLLYQAGSFKFSCFKKNNRMKQICAITAGMVLAAFSYYMLSMQTAPLRTIDYQISKYQTAYQFSLLQKDIAEIPNNSKCVVYLNEEDVQDYYCRDISQYYLRTETITRCYDETTALNQCASNPWTYYIDLSTGIVYPPTETVGVELHTRPATTAYGNSLAIVGYKENSRYSVSSAADVTMYDLDTTGYLAAKAGDIIRLNNVLWRPTADNESRVGVYWFADDKTYLSHSAFKTAEDVVNWAPLYDHQGNIVQITVPSNIGSSVAYLRITCQDIDDDSVITINEEIP